MIGKFVTRQVAKAYERHVDRNPPGPGESVAADVAVDAYRVFRPLEGWLPVDEVVDRMLERFDDRYLGVGPTSLRGLLRSRGVPTPVRVVDGREVAGVRRADLARVACRQGV